MSNLFSTFVASCFLAGACIVLSPLLGSSTTIETNGNQGSRTRCKKRLPNAIKQDQPKGKHESQHRSSLDPPAAPPAPRYRDERVPRQIERRAHDFETERLVDAVDAESFPSRLTQHPTSDQAQSLFFRLPGEIRMVIYHQVLNRTPRTALMKLRANAGYEPEIVRAGQERSSYPPYAGDEVLLTWYRGLHDRSSVHLPYVNGLAQTCRRAYQESGHILFQKSHFSFGKIELLEFFVRSFLPRHVQDLSEMTIRGFLLPQDEEMTMYSPSPYRCDGLYLLAAFTGLRILHIKDDRREDDKNIRVPYPQKLMKALFRATSSLRSLQTIDYTSCEMLCFSPIYDYARMRLDYDEIPGWVYSFEFLPLPGCRWMRVLIETLTRCHEPLWPECEEQTSRIDENPSLDPERKKGVPKTDENLSFV